MTVAEYIRLVAKIAVLKEVAEEYPGKTIENIILQMEAVKNEIGDSTTKRHGSHVEDVHEGSFGNARCIPQSRYDEGEPDKD